MLTTIKFDSVNSGEANTSQNIDGFLSYLSQIVLSHSDSVCKKRKDEIDDLQKTLSTKNEELNDMRDRLANVISEGKRLRLINSILSNLEALIHEGFSIGYKTGLLLDSLFSEDIPTLEKLSKRLERKMKSDDYLVS